MSSLKVCIKCGEEKELSLFPKRKDAVDGHRNDCKACKLIKDQHWRNSNKELVRARQPEYDRRSRARHLEKCRERDRNYSKNNRAKRTAAFREWRHRNPDKVRQSNERHKDYQRDWAKNNLSVIRESQRQWRLRNPDKARTSGKVRAAQLKLATPKWLTGEHKQEIAAIYKSAATRSAFHELPFHVDHIEPLNGKTSNGLHVPWNLEVIQAEENLKKGNKLLSTLNN